MSSSHRNTFSISAEFYRRLCAEADRRGIRPTRLVELACADLSTVDADAVRRSSWRARGVGVTACNSEVPIEVDVAIADGLDRVAAVRGAQRGRTVTAADVLDGAINNFLDAAGWPRAGGAR